MWRAQPVLMPGQVAGKKPPQSEREAEEHKEPEPEWTSEHAARAADALEGAYSPDFDAEALPPEVSCRRLCARPFGMAFTLPMGRSRGLKMQRMHGVHCLMELCERVNKMLPCTRAEEWQRAGGGRGPWRAACSGTRSGRWRSCCTASARAPAAQRAASWPTTRCSAQRHDVGLQGPECSQEGCASAVP